MRFTAKSIAIKRGITGILCLLLLAFAACLSANAQSGQQDSDSIAEFVNSVAQTVYNLAWPTATYREVSLNDIQPVDGGVDVSIKLSGQSAFDNSNLWVRLVIMIRDGEIKDIRVRDHNAFLMAPFATTQALASAAAEMAKEYDAQKQADSGKGATPPQPTHTDPVRKQAVAGEGACLINSTDDEIAFDYRWGDSAWKEVKVAPNTRVRLLWNFDDGEQSSPELSIRYDDDYAPGYTERDYVLQQTASALPFSCDSAINYRFTTEGAKIALYKIGAQ